MHRILLMLIISTLLSSVYSAFGEPLDRLPYLYLSHKDEQLQLYIGLTCPDYEMCINQAGLKQMRFNYLKEYTVHDLLLLSDGYNV